jgi:monofunctional biosynthetic peptidoglycan transglycosylase
LYPRPLFQIERESRLGFLLRLITGSLLGLLVAMILLTASLRWVDPPMTAFMLAHKWLSLQQGQSTALDYRWVELSEISPQMRAAVIAAEDQRFYQHGGFDFDAIRANLLPGNESSDLRFSTLTQQLARNLFLWEERSVLRKSLEAVLTVVLEVSADKNRILTLYLNTAEFGHGIFGVESAAQHFFAKPASELNSREAAALAAVLPHPGVWSPLVRNREMQARIQLILERMAAMDDPTPG